MNGNNDESLAMLNLLCSPDGSVVGQAPPRLDEPDEFDPSPGDMPGDDWRSNGVLAKSLGMALVKTWWFDHVDCDQRELQQVLRNASKGKHARVRVWMRMTDHELVRAELTATPLADASGDVQFLMVRTEPTSSMQRRREAQRKPGDEPVIKPYRAAAEQPAPAPAPAHTDLLSLRLPVPLLRLDLTTGTVLGANDALADLLGHADRSTCTRIPLTELVPVSDRPAVSESLGNLARGASSDRTIETRLHGPNERELHTRLLLFADPAATTAQTMFAVVRDVSADRLMLALMQSADVQTQVAQAHEARLKGLERLLANTPTGLALIDSAGEVVEANAVMQQLLDAMPAEANSITMLARDALAGRSTLRASIAVADGRKIALLASPVEGNLASVLSIDTDVVLPPRDVLADTTASGVLAMPALLTGVITPDGRLVRSSESLRAVLAQAEADEPLPVSDLVAPASRQAFAEMLSAARSLKPVSARRIELLAPDGRLVPTMLGLASIESNDPAHVLLIASDSSASETKLEQQRTKLSRMESLAQRQPVALLSIARSTGHVTAANPAACELLRAGGDRLIGAPLPELPADLSDAIRAGRALSLSKVALGATTIVDAHLLPAGDECELILLDRTESIAREQQLDSTSRQSATLAEAQQAGVIEWDIVTGDVVASDRATALLACDARPGNTSSLFARIDPSDREKLERALFDAMEPSASAARSTLDVRLRAAGKPLRLFGQFVFDTEGAHAFPVRAVLVALDDAPTAHRESLERSIAELKMTLDSRDRDLTDQLSTLRQRDERIEQCDQVIAERDEQLNALRNQLASKETELQERDRTARLRTAEINAIVEAMQGSLRLQSEGHVRTSEAASRLFGANASQLFDDPAAWVEAMRLTALDGTLLPAHELPIARARASGSTASADVLIQTGDGREAAVRTTAAPVVLDGEVVGVACIDTDRTDLRDTHRLLADRDREIEQLFDTASLGMAQIAPDATIRRANRQLAVMLGFPAEEIAGRQLRQLTTDDDRVALGRLSDVIAGRAGEASIELNLLRRDGQAVPTQLTFVAARSGLATALVQDLSLLRETQKQVDSLESELTQLRARHEAALAASSEGVVMIDREGRTIEANAAARRLLGIDGTGPVELGSLRFTNVAGKSVANNKLPWAGKERSAIELRAGPDGVVSTYSATRLRDGCVVVTMREATQRIELQEEIQRTQARVIEAHTLMQSRVAEQAERLAAVVRQFRAPAAGAVAPARALIADEQRLPADLRDAARSVLGLTALQIRLADALPDAARLQSSDGSDREVLDVHAMLREAIRAVADTHAGRRIDLRADAGPGARVSVTGPAARHAVWSLLGEVIRRSTVSANIVISTQLDSAADRVSVSIETSGVAKGASDDTSLDEQVAHALLRADAASFDPAITTGSRRTWRIDFPLAAESAPAVNAPSESSMPARPLRVLLVEDHDSTARVISRQLIRLDCVVEVARSVSEAESLLDRSPGEADAFGLVVSDLTLPDGSASEFMSRVASRHAIPGIALRGYGSQDDEQLLHAAGFVESLMKPVDLNALSTSIRRIRAEGASRE